MNCENATTLIFEQTTLTDDERAALRAHLDDCEACRRLHEKDQQIAQQLGNAVLPPSGSQASPLEASDARILDRAMHRVRAIEHSERSRRNFGMGAGLGFALAASLFIALFGNTLLTGIGIDGSSPLTNINMTANVQRSVNIMFDSPEAVAEATITIYLPEHISVAGYDNMHELSWKTALKAGKNSLKLPLVASRNGDGVIRSELKIGDMTRSFKLAVDVSPGTGNTSALQTRNG